MNARRPVLAVISLLLPVAFARAGAPPSDPPADPKLTTEQVASSVLSAMDRKADPCQDFYRYACGGWLDASTIPADKSRYGRGFTLIGERNRDVLRQILEEAAKHPEGATQKLGDYYGACMDEAAIEALGAAPLKPLLAEIQGVKDPRGVMEMVGKLHARQVGALFRAQVNADFKDPELDIAHLFQGGLGLPDRDYYLKDDDKSKGLRDEYVAHVTRMLGLVGERDEDAKADAGKILAFETELAKASVPRAELRDPEKIYHKVDLKGLKELTPELSWDAYFAGIGSGPVTDISVAVPGFMTAMSKLVATTPPETLRTYLRWHLAHDAAPFLSKPFVDETFAFYGQKLAGQKENEVRWKRCVSATDDAMGELLGQAFVDRQFPGDSKQKAIEMIRGVEAAFAENLPNLTWMDDTTRERAKGKMEALSNKIGYPDKWRDYSKLQIKAGDAFGNELAARRFDFDYNFAKIGKKVDPTEWAMTPPTVNAYYNPLQNEMVFPAGILQSPFFHRDFPTPLNFGGMGMVVGHELTHGFDDQGRKFDPKGRLAEWWDPSVAQKFQERAQCVDNLYSSYEVQPGVHLNGKLTLGENIADLGGVKEAFHAYQAWAKARGETKPAVEGLTNDQLFFVGFAQTWCSLATPEIERMLATVDPHSAPKFRVIGPLSNTAEFAEAFECAPATPMNPEKKCEVW